MWLSIDPLSPFFLKEGVQGKYIRQIFTSLLTPLVSIMHFIIFASGFPSYTNTMVLARSY